MFLAFSFFFQLSNYLRILQQQGKYLIGFNQSSFLLNIDECCLSVLSFFFLKNSWMLTLGAVLPELNILRY